MVEYGYINEDGYLRSKVLEEYEETVKDENGDIIPKKITIEMQIEELKKMGWKPVELVDDSKVETDEEFMSIHIKPVDLGDRIGYEYIKEYSIALVRNEIIALKNQLDNDDYKIIKCYEADLLQQPLPYDIKQLHAERQAVRDKINELELVYESKNKENEVIP